MMMQFPSPGTRGRIVMKLLRSILVFLVILGTTGWAGGGVIPEMEECMRAHTTPTEYQYVIGKYADPGIIRQAMGLLILKEPYVVRTEKEGPITTHTVEGMTVGTSSEIPSDVVQVYKVGWEKGKIISIEFKGLKI
jgi:hypothetical protein